MATGKFVTYFRVSTSRQAASGLGLEAQRSAVVAFLNGGDWKVCGEHTETESGKVNDRPELAKAVEACRLYGAKLLIAKLDRLSRDAHFLLGLERAGIEFVAADMPTANRLTVGILAMVAEEERRMISARTTAALAAAKARGVVLGGARRRKDGTLAAFAPDTARKASVASLEARQAKAAGKAASVLPTIHKLQAGGASTLRALAAGLTAEGIPTPRGNTLWTASQVSRILSSNSR